MTSNRNEPVAAILSRPLSHAAVPGYILDRLGALLEYFSELVNVDFSVEVAVRNGAALMMLFLYAFVILLGTLLHSLALALAPSDSALVDCGGSGLILVRLLALASGLANYAEDFDDLAVVAGGGELIVPITSP